MATRIRSCQARTIGLALLAGSLFAGGCETSSAVGPQPVSRESQASLDLLNRVNSLESELAALRNTVEVQQNEITRLKDRLDQVYADIDRRLSTVERGGPGYSAAPVYPATPAGAAAADVTPAPVSPSVPQSATAAAPVAAEAVVQNTQAAGAEEQAQYDAAFDLLKQSRYEEAIAAFKEFLNEYPRSVLADSAQYWIAEARYVTRAYDAALHEYNTLIQRYPGSRKLPDAMLKVGYIHYDNQQWPEARRALNAVVKRYPGSRVAVSAKLRLDQMTKQGH